MREFPIPRKVYRVSDSGVTAVLVWHIGDVILKVLETRGWNQKTLAAEAKVTPNTVSDAITRRANTETDTLDKIARALGFASWEDLAQHVPHDPEQCGRLVTSSVILPDDDASRQLASAWRDLPPADRYFFLDLMRHVMQRVRSPG